MIRQIINVSLAAMKSVNKFQVGISQVKIEFLPGKSWFLLTHTPGTFDLSEKQKTDASGVLFEQKLKCNYTRYERTDDNRVHYWQMADLLLKVEYNTGETEIIGCPAFPVRLNATLEVGKSTVYKLEFTCSTIYRALSLVN